MIRPTTALALATLVLAAAAPAAAAGPVGVDAAVGVHSEYVWRGQIVTAEAVLQPEVTVGALGLSCGAWGNVDLTDANGFETSLAETDWSVGYAVSLPLVSLGAGFIRYDYPSRGPQDTSELYVGGEAHVALSPHLWVYRDVDVVEGTYVNVGGSWDRSLGEATALEIAADLGWGSAGYVRGFFGPDQAGVGDLTVAARLPWRPLPPLTVTPQVSFATLLGDAKEAVDERGDDTATVFYGVTARVGF